MNFKQFLTEMPITNFQKLGHWGEKDPKRGYSKQDIGILTNEKGIQKIKTKWEKTPFNFDLYFLRSKEGYKTLEVGHVTQEYLNDILKINIPINQNNITIIFTQNIATEKVPMNAWTIAHRFGHAANRLNSYQIYTKEMIDAFKTIAKNYLYNNISYSNENVILKSIAHALGTMKSARDRKLVNYYEFFHELFAQYLLTGKIKFNIPDKIITNFAWGKPQYNYIENYDDFEMYIQDYLQPLTEDNIKFVLKDCVGKIFVM